MRRDQLEHAIRPGIHRSDARLCVCSFDLKISSAVLTSSASSSQVTSCATKSSHYKEFV
jgi:hypothetical protein